MEEKKVPHIFEAGKGINATNINADFKYVQDSANSNESKLTDIDSKALRKDGTNIEQDLVDKFKQDEPIVLENRWGDIALTDNKTHFLSLSGNGKIILPNISDDQFSHTITLIVNGSSYTLDASNGGTLPQILTKGDVDISKPCNVLYIYHKVHRAWYYYISQ